MTRLLWLAVRALARTMLAFVLALIVLLGGWVGYRAWADYPATTGGATTFASKVISTVNYAAMVICDAVAGETQCTAVNAAGQLAIQGAPPYKYTALGVQQVSVSTTAVVLPTVATSTIVQVCVEGNPVRYRDDGTAPTATVGILAGVGCFSYSGPLTAMQFIATAAGSATVDVGYYK